MVDSGLAPVSCNTGALSDNSVGLLRVAVGLDTLALFCKGECSPDLMASLLDARSGVISNALACGVAAEPIDSGLSFGGEPLMLLPYAQRGWSVVLHNVWAHVQLGRSGVTDAGAMVKLSAEFLWSVPGWEARAMEAVAFCVDGLGFPVEAVQLSEAHLCADVAGVAAVQSKAAIKAGMVGHVATLIEIDKRGEPQTVMIGERAQDVSAVTYDKLAEIANSGKGWFLDIWRRAGWDEVAPVWRTEFRLRRGALRELQVLTVDDLIDGGAGKLWAYCTARYLRLAEPSASDSRRSRWVNCALWDVIAAPWPDDLVMTPPLRVRNVRAKVDPLVRQALGCLLSAGALTSMDWDGTARLLVSAAEDRQVRYGLDWVGLVEARSRRYAAGMAA